MTAFIDYIMLQLLECQNGYSHTIELPLPFSNFHLLRNSGIKKEISVSLFIFLQRRPKFTYDFFASSELHKFKKFFLIVVYHWKLYIIITFNFLNLMFHLSVFQSCISTMRHTVKTDYVFCCYIYGNIITMLRNWRKGKHKHRVWKH